LLTCYEALNCVYMIECSCCVFSFDCGFNHVSYVWLGAKFNGKVNGIDFVWIGVRLYGLFYKGMHWVRVFLYQMETFGLIV